MSFTLSEKAFQAFENGDISETANPMERGMAVEA
jgi:hypothetical protein